MFAIQDYRSGIKPVFCPGCGDYGVLSAITKAFADLQLDPDNTVVVSGIGCSSSMPHDFKCYGIHGIHGRALPIAEGVKLANSELNVVVVGGDGDGYGIGLQHLIHAARRNINITYIIMDNEIYGLTTGQASPTSSFGQKTKSTPFGVIEKPINPMSLLIASGASYVARGFSGEPMHLAELIKNGIKHKGFSVIDVESPCVSFNKLNTFEWARRVVYKIEGHDPKDLSKAMEKAFEFELNPAKLSIGLLYESDRKTYEELEVELKGNKVLAKQDMLGADDILSFLDEYNV
ncbi:thiamine pyrophosphate-dependent enzyme [Candidatus Marsarchaeota archaeon]|nr:thiamine pyrophosphate-dependent enzyme [Candidatus Marsarchaeota archaeon]